MGDHTSMAESPWPAVDREEVKTYKDSRTEVLFAIFFSSAGVRMTRAGVRCPPRCLRAFQGGAWR